MSVRSITLASLLALLPGTAFAGAEIRAKIVDLRAQPSDNAKARLKLGAGREVAVLGKSDDGRWVKVSGSLERGEDTIKFEGWVMAVALDGDVPSSSAASSDSGEADWGDEGSSSSASESASADSGNWDFSEETTSAAASAPAGDNSWDTGSSDTSSSSSDDSWDDSSSSSSSSSSSGEDWGDSGSSDDSGDDWDS